MQLTNKTNNGQYFWREAGNRFYIEIDGKPIELKFSVAQSEAYQALISEEKAQKKSEAENRESDPDLSELLTMRITKSIEHAAKVVEIALNPKGEKVYTKDQVLDLFGDRLDLLQIVARTWVDKKVFNPSLNSVLDPLLAP